VAGYYKKIENNSQNSNNGTSYVLQQYRKQRPGLTQQLADVRENVNRRFVLFKQLHPPPSSTAI